MAVFRGNDTDEVRAMVESSLAEIDKWEQNMKDHMADLFGQPEDFITPDIILDGERKVDRTEGISPEEVRKRVREILDRNRETVDKMPGGDWLERYFSGDCLNEDSYPSWRRQMRHVGFSEPEREVIREIDDVVSRQSVEEKTLGEYSPSDNTITLYYNNIANPDFDRRFTAKARMTLAHEMFHAYHCKIAGNTYFGTSGYVMVVKEALADFYSYLYCMDPNAAFQDGVDEKDSRDAARRRARIWERNQYYNWPYAYARFFMNENGEIDCCEDFIDCVRRGMVDKFRCVLELSKINMYRAYCELVPPEFRRDYHNKKAGTKGKGRKSSWVINLDGTGDPLTREDYWEILKKVIKLQDVESFDELKMYFPEDILELEEGEFVMLGNGQIICGDNHWEVLKGYDFLVIAKELGVPITFQRQTDAAGNLIAIIRGQTKPGEYAIATVGDPSWAKPYSYICDFSTYAVIRVGDTVIAPVKNKNRKELTVEKLEIKSPAAFSFPLKKILKVK